jgi:hypothetical protein
MTKIVRTTHNSRLTWLKRRSKADDISALLLSYSGEPDM